MNWSERLPSAPSVASFATTLPSISRLTLMLVPSKNLQVRRDEDMTDCLFLVCKCRRVPCLCNEHSAKPPSCSCTTALAPILSVFIVPINKNVLPESDDSMLRVRFICRRCTPYPRASSTCQPLRTRQVHKMQQRCAVQLFPGHSLCECTTMAM